MLLIQRSDTNKGHKLTFGSSIDLTTGMEKDVVFLSYEIHSVFGFRLISQVILSQK